MSRPDMTSNNADSDMVSNQPKVPHPTYSTTSSITSPRVQGDLRRDLFLAAAQGIEAGLPLHQLALPLDTSRQARTPEDIAENISIMVKKEVKRVLDDFTYKQAEAAVRGLEHAAQHMLDRHTQSTKDNQSHRDHPLPSTTNVISKRTTEIRKHIPSNCWRCHVIRAHTLPSDPFLLPASSPKYPYPIQSFRT
jgi:hypothetical protein